MTVLSKTFLIFAFSVASSSAASFEEEETLKSFTTEESLSQSSDSLPPSPEKTRKAVRISEKDNTSHDPTSPYILQQNSILEHVICIDQSAITELNTSDILTITFRSDQTGANYTLRSEIGKRIHDYIRLLKKNGILNGNDRKEYNYGGPIRCSPILPINVLESLGTKALSGETIITKDVAIQLNLHNCMLSFSFISQTEAHRAMGYSDRLRTPEQIDKDKALERSNLRIAVQIMRSPPDKRMSTNVLHMDYVAIKENGIIKVISTCK